MQKKEGGGDAGETQRQGESLGLYEYSYILALNAAFIDILNEPGCPLKPIPLEELFALSCSKLGCAALPSSLCA